jgi:lipoic acid synthetase
MSKALSIGGCRQIMVLATKGYQRQTDIITVRDNAGSGREEGGDSVRWMISEVGCDVLTIGQYLRPSKGNLPVVEYVEEVVFAEYGDIARKKGFIHVASAPLVRSSFNAEEVRKVIKRMVN